MGNAKLKTLSSCSLPEFLRQTNKIKKNVEKWLSETDILNIRKKLPTLKEIPEDATKEERQKINEENKEMLNRQMKQNMSEILDAALEDHAQETAEVIALCCFVEPDDMDGFAVRDYLLAFTEMLNDEAVIGFFISLVQLGQNPILKELKV